MQNKYSEVSPEPTETADLPNFSGRFGDVGALLAQDMPVVNGRPEEIDPYAKPVAPVSMKELRPDPASTEARVAMELAAAQAVLDAANKETLTAIAQGGAGAIAPQLKDNPSLLIWMKERASDLLKAEDSARETGGQVLYFTLTRMPDSGRSQYLERSHADFAERNPRYGRHHVLPGRKSFLEARRQIGLSHGGNHYTTSTR